MITLGLVSCSNFNNSNYLDSDTFKTKKERVACLKNEIKSKSEFDNAEFELFNVNGFSNSRITTIPGTSSWDYKFVIRVNPSDIDKWTQEMLEIEPKNYNLNWTTEIIEKRAIDWITNSLPEFYTRTEDNVLIIIFRTEGIIYKRMISN
ncbi:hypothetical protein [Psychroserpens sp.]|uniref:hypothetical protein n=1 Tax=Psychroserpens sp. TaxID=2020870 RepID=UPI003CC5E844